MKKKYLILIITLIAVAFSTLIWDIIKLPYDFKNEIYGEYAKQNHNPHNDTIRYILFISIPLIAFLLSYLYFFREKLFTINQVINRKVISFPKTNNKIINLFFYLILFLVIINFLSLDYNRYFFNLDFFHEGTYLTPSKNFQFNGNFWLSSYLDYGLLGNYFPIIIWKIFGLETIGSTRFFQLILLLFNKILIILLCKKISENLSFDKNISIIYFVFVSILSASLIELDFRSSYIPGKFFLIFLFLLTFFESLKSNEKQFTYNFLIGLICVVSIFSYIDIGIYLNALLFFLLIYSIFRTEYKKVLFITTGLLCGFLFFYISLSSSEIAAFYSNILALLSTIDYLDGIVYPTPFFSGDIRSTRALLLIIIAGILVIIFNFNKKIKEKSEVKIFFIFLFLLNILIFKSAIVRSDTPHLKTASSLVIFLLILTIAYFLIRGLISAFKNFNNLKKYYLAAPITILFFSSFTPMHLYDFKNTLFSFSQIDKLLIQKDDKYLKKEYIEMINYYKNLTKDEKCVQIFTNEAAIPYLLKKPSCTKYYLMWISAPNENQMSFIKDLKTQKPKFILFRSDVELYNDTHIRMPLVLDYINSNYSFYGKFKHWTFIKLTGY